MQRNLLKSLPTIAQLYGKAELGQFVTIKCRFHFFRAKATRSAVRMQARKCCDIDWTRAVLFPPSNCTRMLAHSEINSTRGKYSRKYGIWWCQITSSTQTTSSQWIFISIQKLTVGGTWSHKSHVQLEPLNNILEVLQWVYWIEISEW